MSEKEIASREIRFAVHIPEKFGLREDTHYVKEQIYYKDGTTAPNTYLIENYERPVWVTKPMYRDHKSKKEREHMDKLTRYSVTESKLPQVIAAAIDKRHLSRRLKELKKSPYVYGADQTSTSLIKLRNLKTNNYLQHPYTLSVLDIESTTDEHNKKIHLITIVMKDKLFMAVVRSFLPKGKSDERHREAFKACVAEYLPAYKDFPMEIGFADTEVEAIMLVFNRLHQWKPDLLAVWNIGFDMRLMEKKLRENNILPEDIFCDPDLPKELRVCEFKEGVTHMTTSSGKHKPLPPSLQWHTYALTASFFPICAMASYRQLRIGSPEEQDYGLDAILNKEGLGGKLEFKQADKYLSDKKKWHDFMQANYPYEYMVYNIWDCLSVLKLEDKTKDLSERAPSVAQATDFAKFNSNPKKIVDAQFDMGLGEKLVIGCGGGADTLSDTPMSNKPEFGYYDNDVVDDTDYSTLPEDVLFAQEAGDEELSDFDNKDGSECVTLNQKGWIQTLPQGNLMNIGMKILKDYPTVRTAVRLHCFDADKVSSYPTVGIVCNVSKPTTRSEIIEIEGISETTFREANLGLIPGEVNAVTYCTTMFNLPKLEDL